MRFECKVRVVNRTPGGKSSPNYVKSTIALGKETHTDNDYFLLHFSNFLSRGSQQGSRYNKYRLKGNPTRVFTRCINEGKITISFEDPQYDLFIQGETLHLSKFVELLYNCLAGEVGVLRPSSLNTEARDRYNKHMVHEQTDGNETSLEEKRAALLEKKAALLEENAMLVEVKTEPVEVKTEPVEKEAMLVEEKAMVVKVKTEPLEVKTEPVEKEA